MKTSSVSVLIGVSVLLLSGPTVSAVSLHVSPNHPQFFTGDSVSLSCVGDGQEADGWTLKRTAGGHTEEMVRFNSRFSSIISTLRQSDTGVYWCETSSGQRNDQTTITVTDPKAPPQTSSPLSSSLIGIRAVVFSLVLLVLVVVLVLVGVVSLSRNQSDAVRHVQRRHAAGLPLLTATVVAVLLYGLLVSAASSLSVIRLCCHLVVCCPFCVSTGLMASICCSRKTGDKPVVSMETTQRVEGRSEVDEDYDDITADVTTEYDF